MARRILIVKLSSIGDVVHALPAARALRLAFPDAYLCWAVHSSCREVVEGNPSLNEVYVLQDKSLGGVIRAGRELAHGHFDTAIDMQGLFRSGLLTWLSRAPERIGFSGTQELHHLFLTHPVVNPRQGVRAPYSQMEFAAAAGAARIEPIPEIVLTAAVREEAAALLEPALQRGGPIVIVNPGAAWTTKRWWPDGYAAAADRLVERRGASIVLIGAPGDRPSANRIAAEMKYPSLNLAGRTTLKTLCAVFERSALYVGGDTGPMHLAAAMGTPVAAVFGPTNPNLTGPVGSPSRIIRHPVPCGPCRRRECDHHSCMRLITAAEVAGAASELLDIS